MAKKDSDDKTLQIITHAIGIFAYILGALLIFALTKNKEVKMHAKNALNWQISLLIYYVSILTLSSISAFLMSISTKIFIIFPLVSPIRPSSRG